MNFKIFFGFLIVALLLVLAGAVSYWSLLRVERSFTVLEESLSREIIGLEKIRADYSALLLEMTTFLILKDPEAVSLQRSLIAERRNKFISSLADFKKYFVKDEPDYLKNLEDVSGRSLVLIDEIVERRARDEPLSVILPLKKVLKELEGKEFSPLIDSLLSENLKKIAREKSAVDDASREALILITIFVFLGFVASLATGIIISFRERRVDEFRDHLISIASHQMKAPLTVMKGHIEMLEESGLADKQKQVAADLKESHRDLLAVVNDLLDLSRIEDGRFKLNPERISLRELVEHAIKDSETLAAIHKVSLRVEKPPSECFIFADKSRVGQAVKNLMDNAVKYSREGGEVLAKLEPQGETFFISIQDNGIGIPRQDQKRIFERFFRASNTAGRKSGSGLGLFIVKEIVEQSGGKVWFESPAFVEKTSAGREENVGTTFYLRLPKA